MPNPATQIAPGDITAPAVPSAPLVVPYGRGLQITVSYSPPTDFFRYRYFKNGVLWRETPANSQIDYDVNYNTTYQYTVAAMDTALPTNVSAQSGIGSGVPVPIGGTDISGNSIGTAHIQANSIQNAHIQANAIQTANIVAGNITTLTIAAGNITNLTIQDGAVGTTKVTPNAISGVTFVSLTTVNHTLNATSPTTAIPGVTVSRTLINQPGSGVILNFTGIWLIQNSSALVVSAGMGVTLLRDGAVAVSGAKHGQVLTTTPGPGNNGQATVQISVVDFPGAGLHTWTVTWVVQSTNFSTLVSATCQSAQLEAVELKR